jgi:hypothetical protein
MEPLATEDGAVKFRPFTVIRNSLGPDVMDAGVMLTSTGGAPVEVCTWMEQLRVAAAGARSTASTVKLKVPAAGAVPAIMPVSKFKKSPDGRAPAEILQRYGGCPPCADSTPEYGCPTVATSVGHAVRVRGAAIVIEKSRSAVVPEASVTRIEN